MTFQDPEVLHDPEEMVELLAVGVQEEEEAGLKETIQEGEMQINHQSTGALHLELQNHLLSTSPNLGLQVGFTVCKKKIILNIIFNNEKLKIIVSETNCYYEQQRLQTQITRKQNGTM